MTICARLAFMIYLSSDMHCKGVGGRAKQQMPKDPKSCEINFCSGQLITSLVLIYFDQTYPIPLLCSHKVKQKHQYNLKHSKAVVFKKGIKVLKKGFLCKKRKGGKLDAKWVGPYSITSVLGKGFYSLKSVENPTEIVSRVNGAP